VTNNTIHVMEATRWYGQVIGVNDVSMKISSGVTGLLGPNGAGKSTIMKLIVGHILPNQGRVDVDGRNPFYDHMIKRDMGYVPETDGLPDKRNGLSFIKERAVLRGYSSRASREAATEALKVTGLYEVGTSKKIGAYSKGMRQRLKLAQAVFHRPEIIVLDEPLTGLDPVGRKKVIDLIKTLGREGKTVLVSSHVLHEIEAMTDRVVLIVKGKVLAEGTIEHIRSLIDTHPHTVEITTPRPRELAAALLDERCIVNLSLEDSGSRLTIKTRRPDMFYDALGRLVVEKRFEIKSFHSPDNNLQAVFDYLVK